MNSSKVVKYVAWICLLGDPSLGWSQSHPLRPTVTPIPTEMALAPFYSHSGREHQVQFASRFQTEAVGLDTFRNMTDLQRQNYVANSVLPLFRYLFGPLTNREEGSPQKGDQVVVDWPNAQVIDGRVSLPYQYRGTWILRSDIAALPSLTLPVPLNASLVLTPGWKACTDPAPDHQTLGFYWYFWDPARYGCDQTEGRQFVTVSVLIGPETPNDVRTFPEYPKLLQSAGRPNNFQLTYGFGYIQDVASPNPEADMDAGVAEYRKFVQTVRSLRPGTFREETILQGEYLSAWRPSQVIGHRFIGRLAGVDVTINVVAAAGIDQMEIFAKSFAHDHDGFFAWLGHSRVGSGFDADRFQGIVAGRPDYYQVTPQYQLVYWGGCNSYSYYTLPFFAIKARASGGSDPRGTRGLDLIANGLPSYFSLNGTNAGITLRYLLNWQARPSYQDIIDALEQAASMQGIPVLAVVLGDEDNPT